MANKSEPLVAAIMLTKDRPAMARRAVECFRAQTYANKILIALDSGSEYLSGDPFPPIESSFGAQRGEIRHCLVPVEKKNRSIGMSRNVANSLTSTIGAEILIHWDDDDWSHPNRIAEQVALLQSSGADCVGYRSLLCWRTDAARWIDSQNYPAGFVCCPCGENYPRTASYCPKCRTAAWALIGEAWRYSHPWPSYALGASLCYWRKTWEQRPFRDINKGEDTKFIEGLRMMAEPDISYAYCEPLMIIGMHGGNTCNTTDPAAEAARGSDQWHREPEWDSYCRERMALNG